MCAADETFTFEVRMSSASSASFFCDNKNIGETAQGEISECEACGYKAGG